MTCISILKRSKGIIVITVMPGPLLILSHVLSGFPTGAAIYTETLRIEFSISYRWSASCPNYSDIYARSCWKYVEDLALSLAVLFQNSFDFAHLKWHTIINTFHCAVLCHDSRHYNLKNTRTNILKDGLRPTLDIRLRDKGRPLGFAITLSETRIFSHPVSNVSPSIFRSFFYSALLFDSSPVSATLQFTMIHKAISRFRFYSVKTFWKFIKNLWIFSVQLKIFGYICSFGI